LRFSISFWFHVKGRISNGLPFLICLLGNVYLEIQFPSDRIMTMRKFEFTNNEYYHVLNRGVDKREVFLDSNDMARFFQSMDEFNNINPIGSIFENSFKKLSLGNPVSKREKLVNFICYCLNPNHYHFLLEQLVDNGVEKFMHRLGVGYTKYFNKKYDRVGALFQGNYKATHIYVLRLLLLKNITQCLHLLLK